MQRLCQEACIKVCFTLKEKKKKEHKTPQRNPHWFLPFTDFVILHSKILSHRSKLDILHIKKEERKITLSEDR